MNSLNIHHPTSTQYNNNLEKSVCVTLNNQHLSINDNYFQSQEDEKEVEEKEVKVFQESHIPEIEVPKKASAYRHQYLEDYLRINELVIMILDYCASSECAKATSPEVRKIWYERNDQIFKNINYFFYDNKITNFDFLIDNIESWTIQISQYVRTLAYLSDIEKEKRYYEDLDIEHIIPYLRDSKLKGKFKEKARKIDQDLWTIFKELFKKVPVYEKIEDEEFGDYFERISADSTETWIKGANARWWLEHPKISRHIKSATRLEFQQDFPLQTIPIEIRKLSYLRLIDLRGNRLSEISLDFKNQQIFRPLEVDFKKLKQHPYQIDGIEPEVGNHLKHLHLGLNLFTQFPYDIFNLVNLEVLHFEENKLKNIPSDITRLIHLTELNLSGNQLKELPREIGDVTTLKKLEVNSNHLITLPNTIGKLSNLQSLYLDNNEIISIPNTIGNLTNLGVLSLNANYFTSLPSEIGNLTSLTSLSLTRPLHHNSLESLPSEIGNLLNLKSILIGGNENLTIPLTLKKILNNGCRVDLSSALLERLYEKPNNTTCILQ